MINIVTYTTGRSKNKVIKMDNQNNDFLINFKKARSHIEKIVKMVENREYCINIMQQNLAVIGLLKSAHQKLMEGHLKSCFQDAMQTNNKVKKQKMVEEILKVSKLANK